MLSHQIEKKQPQYAGIEQKKERKKVTNWDIKSLKRFTDELKNARFQRTYKIILLALMLMRHLTVASY